MEKGDHRPFILDESPSWSFHDNNASVEDGHALLLRSRQKPYNWKAPAIILGFEFLESIAFAGISLNLVVYLANVLHGTTASNAANVDTWNGTTFLAPVLGAFLADTYLGKYKTIFISVILYLLGMLTITGSAMIPSLQPPACNGTSCPAATEFQYAVFFIALYLIAIGTGGVKSALMPFGADQYDEANPEEAQKKQSFFSMFFVAVNLGVFIAGTVVVWIQQNIAWSLGFGISLACLVVAAVGFFLGTPIYRVQMPTGSPLKSVIRVFIVAFKKRHLELPKDSELLFEEFVGQGMEGQHRLEHTDGLSCLDKAAIVADPYSTDPVPATPLLSCTVTQVEEVKILLRMVPIWLTCIFYSASMCQTTTTFLQQGVLMDPKIGPLSIPAASLSSIEVIFMMIFVVIQDKLIIPFCRRRFQNPSGLTQLQRMGIGRFLVIFTLAAAAIIESWRLSCYKDNKTISILWQMPQYLVLAWSDVFCGIAQLEFFYGEAPQSMRSLCSAFSFLAISFGYYLNSFVVTFVAAVTKVGGSAGWLPADLNVGHLDYYFWLWAGISVVNFAVYVALARKYTHKKVVFR